MKAGIELLRFEHTLKALERIKNGRGDHEVIEDYLKSEVKRIAGDEGLAAFLDEFHSVECSNNHEPELLLRRSCDHHEPYDHFKLAEVFPRLAKVLDEAGYEAFIQTLMDSEAKS